MRLVGDNPDNPKLLTVRSKRDITPIMLKYTEKRFRMLETEKLRGFVFKAKSPTSGMRGVKIYTEQGLPSRSGSGIFAREFMKAFPNLPVEDEGRLNDAGIRENFIETLFTYDRWRNFVETDALVAGFVTFHSSHKYLLMAHSPDGLREAGKIVASAGKSNLNEKFHLYENILVRIMRLHATVKKHVNVLQHIMGYFKNQLSTDEKQELLEVIDRYAKTYVPLIVPVTLLNHYIRKYGEAYLKTQWYASAPE